MAKNKAQEVNEKLLKSATQNRKKVGGFFGEFKTFALKGNMIELAVGVLIGSAFSGLVTSLTSNLIQPLINCFGTVESKGLTLNINGQTLNFGAFISDIINFVIMAFIVFLIVKGMNKIGEIGKKKETAEEKPKTKTCPYCKSEIALDATRCPNCTSELE